jgi:glycosyltransferase involved in cell wall biosynthesis
MLGGQKVSGFVITFNEEDNVAACLETMKWADDLVVVDSFSTDRTVEIARRYTDRIIQRPFTAYTDQTRFAFEQTTGDWVLWLDADERLTPQALAEVEERFRAPGGPGADGFAFPRRTCFADRWIMHGGWYPQRKVRLFRREGARIGGNPAHPTAEVSGSIVNVRGDILHYSYPGGLAEMAQRSARFADLVARERYERGGRFSLLKLLFRPPFELVKKYVLQLGLLDGMPGLLIAVGSAYYQFLREAKLYELGNSGSGTRDAG